MNKTVSITIGGAIFNIEEDAYEKLKNYLNAVKEHFTDFDDATEIINDIESRLAEQFADVIKKSKRQAVNSSDVNKIIKNMGEVEEFDDSNYAEENSVKTNSTSWKPAKRLYRNSDDAVIAGVCSGIASFFGIDPVIMRLLFIVATFFGGSGIIAYLVLWVAVPEAKSAAQKLDMQGKPITLNKIEKNIKEAVKKSNIKQSDLRRVINIIPNFIRALGDTIIKVIRNIFPILGAIIGVSITVTIILIIIVISAVAGTLLFNRTSPYLNMDFPIQEIAFGFTYYVGIVSAYLVIIIPIIFILLIGLALASRKNIFNALINTLLIGFWMIAIVAFAVVALQVAPAVEDKIKEINQDMGEVITRNYDLDNFNKIIVGSANKLNIIKGDEFSIKATGREKSIEQLKLNIYDDNELIIKRSSSSACFIFCLENFKSVEFDITMPELNELSLSGASKADVTGFSSEYFKTKLSGASTGNYEIDVLNMDIDISGASRLTLNSMNIANNLKAKVSGASKLYSLNFLAEVIDIDASSASLIEVHSIDDLEVKASGASNIYYKGRPEIDQDLSGASKLLNKND